MGAKQYSAKELAQNAGVSIRTIRFYLHEKYSVNAYGWYPWLFDQLHLKEGMEILDIGCGVGLIWQRSMEKIPEGCRVTCLDQNADSLEALQSCVKRERGKIRAGVEFRMVCGKAEEFSFKAQKYDCVIASYVLGFVRDRDALMEKIRSALKPEGRLFIAASGDRKFHQLHELADEFFGKISPHFPTGTGHDEHRGAGELDGKALWKA